MRQSQDSFSLCLVLSLLCPSISWAADLLPRLSPRGKHLNPLSNHLLNILTRKQHFSDKRIRGKLIFLSRPVSASAYYSLEIMRCASSTLIHHIKLSGVIRIKQHIYNFSLDYCFDTDKETPSGVMRRRHVQLSWVEQAAVPIWEWYKCGSFRLTWGFVGPHSSSRCLQFEHVKSQHALAFKPRCSGPSQ